MTPFDFLSVPMPEPSFSLDQGDLPCYTADQLIAYAAECVRAALQAQAVPVAWMNDLGDVELGHKPWMKEDPGTKWFPLYRHTTPTGEK